MNLDIESIQKYEIIFCKLYKIIYKISLSITILWKKKENYEIHRQKKIVKCKGKIIEILKNENK